MKPLDKISRAMLEGLCEGARIAVLLVDSSGKVVWRNRFALSVFAESFAPGHSFDEALERTMEEAPEDVVKPEREMMPSTVERSIARGRLFRLRSSSDDDSEVYRHDSFPIDSDEAGGCVHYFLDASQEKKLADGFLLSLRQIKSMKEIVDSLYESVSTQEVIYIILVAVTAQMGFGFNRAFFLQVRGDRLRGRIGIGPSNHEEAHQIWSRLGAMNFSSLREVYQNLIREGGVPDPRTQELAVLMDFDLGSLNSGGEGLARAFETGKPSRIHLFGATNGIDRALFELLQTDVVAVVPLTVRGELAGVIIADNFINRKPITEAGLNVLKTFAGYAGVALERSRLYDELRDSVAKLQAANERLKSNQEKLLQAEKLSAVGELAACVSHEIRTPLVAIGGLARSLLQDPIEDQGTRETLQAIGSEVSRLEKFLGETLDFVKPESAVTTTVDLREAIQECLVTFRNEIADGDIDLEEDLPEKPLRCIMEPGPLRRSVTNLIKNAIEAMDGGGTLQVGLQREGLFAVIRVGDTGAGIPPEVQARIFEPFFTTKTGGTGLGLAIASQSMRSIGGRLELEPHPRFTTVFKLVLPLEEAPGEAELDEVDDMEKEEILSRRMS